MRAMPEFMTNLRAACLKLRGGVGTSGLLNPDMFRFKDIDNDKDIGKDLFMYRKEAVRRGMTMLDVDNNPSTMEDEDMMMSKGDASYESAWIDKLLGITDDNSDADGDNIEADNQQRRQSRHNSNCHQDLSRQGFCNSVNCMHFLFNCLLFSSPQFSFVAGI